MRAWLKRALEGALASPAAHAWANRAGQGQALILAYHNVVPAGAQVAGDQSLHLNFDQFRHQLDALSGLVDLTGLVSVLSPGDGRRVTITFDDAYRGALDLALPEMAARGIPATVFVAPGLLGGASPWWDLLADETGSIDPDLRNRCLNEMAGDTSRILAFARPNRARGEPSTEIATEADLAAAVESTPVMLGAHSWSHPTLPMLSGEVLRAELERPLEWLRSRFPDRHIRALAYPYGLFSPAASGACQAAGYRAAFLISGGWFTPPAVHPYAIPRLNVAAGISVDGFRARVNGFFGH